MDARGRRSRTHRAIGLPLALVIALALCAPARAALKPIDEWGAPGPGELLGPVDVDQDNAGNTYVIDLLGPAVQKYDAANNPVQRWGSLGSGPGEFGQPVAIGVNAVTGESYVADLDESASQLGSSIQRYDANGNFLGEFGSFGGAEGQFGIVGGIAVNSVSGDVFVLEAERVQRFSATGQFELMWGKNVVPGGGTGPETCVAGCQAGESGEAEGELDNGQDIASVGSVVYVAEAGNHRVSRFSGVTGAFQLMGGRDVVPGGGNGAETCAAVCQSGIPGAGNGELNNPTGLDATSAAGQLFIVDQNNDRVQRWSAAGLAYQTQWGSSGGADGSFVRPQGLAENGGTVAVTDLDLPRVQTFSSAGAFQAKFGAPGVGTLRVPRGIGVGPGGAYVTDGQNRVVRFDAVGAPISRFGGQGSSPGQFMLPTGIAIAADGTAYVADTENDRIQHFNSGGGFLAEWGVPGNGPGQFTSPLDVAVGPDGRVFVADWGNDRIQRFSPAGSFEAQWGSSGDGPGQFQAPNGLGTDPEGNVYVADTNADRVQAFTADGALLAGWGAAGSGDGQFDGPSDVAADGAGNVYVADRGNNRIQRFTTGGEFREQLGANGAPGDGPGEFSGPFAITTDAAGYVYVADTFNSRIQKLANEPRLKLTGKRRQRAKRLKVRVACKAGPCAVRIKGGGKVKPADTERGSGAKSPATKLKLKPRTISLAAGARQVVKLKLRRAKRRVSAIEAALQGGGKVKLTVRGVATNEAGSARDRRKLKLRR